MRSVHRTVVGGACLAGVLVLAAGGCANPFKPTRSEYGIEPDRTRLRVIRPLDLREVPGAPPADAPVPEITAAGVADRESPLADLAVATLSLPEARAAALVNNLDLRASLIDPSIARTSVGEEEAAFDAAFTFQGSFTDVDTPVANATVSSQAEIYNLEPGVDIPIVTGGRATVSLPTQRVDQLNPFAVLNPSWETDLNVSLSQPLLRNAGRRATTFRLRVAALNDAAAQAQTRVRVISTLASVNQAYWRLYQARQTLEIRQTQFESNRELLGRAERLFEAGTVPEIDVLRAQSGVASSLDGIIRSERDVLTGQRELKRLLNMDRLGVDTGTLIELTTEPDPVEFVFDTDELLALAVENRAELYELELRLAIDQSQVEFDRNQLKPILDLFASYRVNGLDNDYGEAVQNALDRPIQDDITVGVTANVPIGNRAAEARLRRSLLTRIQRVATRDAREQAITQEVLDAVDSLRAAWQSLLAARQSVATAARELSAEQRRFEVGATTAIDVLDATGRLAEQRASEAAALTGYQLAQVDLALATGTLLGAERVEWVPGGLPEDGSARGPERVPGEGREPRGGSERVSAR
ncbi:MAG: TolC family protein [Planctomycetota bacterium]